MKLVSIESPYRSTDQYTIAQNVTFARKVCRWAVDHGYNPYAMHLFYTQFMDDNHDGERDLAIQLGQLWGYQAQQVWFCLRPDERMTAGMRRSEEYFLHVGHLLHYYIFSPEGEFMKKAERHR
jgi:hypothetical protein